MTSAALALLTGICLQSPVSGLPSSDSLAALWSQARSWPEFYAGVNERRDQWRRAVEQAVVPDSIAARARNAGRLRLLVVTVYRCSDSIAVVPLLARLAAVAPNLELRLAHPDQGRWVMEAHRTPDGRAATPTLVVLDENNRQVGCWVERPAELQRWHMETGRGLPDDEYLRQKTRWYEQDGGRSILAEVVAVLESKSCR